MIVEKTYLKICGAISIELLDVYSNLVNYKKNMAQVVLFCNYSNFEIPIGHIFDQLEDLRNGAKMSIKAKLNGVSQEFGLAFDSVPKGYKTICNFEFLNSSIPEVVNTLPRINNWYDSDNLLIFT